MEKVDKWNKQSKWMKMRWNAGEEKTISHAWLHFSYFSSCLSADQSWCDILNEEDFLLGKWQSEEIIKLL